MLKQHMQVQECTTLEHPSGWIEEGETPLEQDRRYFCEKLSNIGKTLKNFMPDGREFFF